MEKLDELLFLKLLKHTYTRANFYYRLEILKEFLEYVFFVRKDTEVQNIEMFKQFLQKRKEDETTKSVLVTLDDALLLEFTPTNLYEVVQQVKHRIKTLPIIVVYVPARFPPKEVIRLGEWFRTHLLSSLLLSLQVDPSVAGGCAFVWKNIYYDFSFKYFLNSKRDKLISIMRSSYDRFNTSTQAAKK